MDYNQIQCVKMIYNLGNNTGLPPNTQVLLYLNTAQTMINNRENPNIISSIINSGRILYDRYDGKNTLDLKNLKNNDSNSFYILPLHSKSHAFSFVVKKVDDSYELTVVDSNDAIKKYGFNKKETLEEKLNQYMPHYDQEASTDIIKKDIANSAIKTIETPVRSKPQTIGNCYYIQIMKGIKVAISDDLKNKKNPQKTFWFKDGNKITTKEFKMKLVEEFKNGMDEETKKEIDKLTIAYKANKKISSLYKGLKGKLTPPILKGLKINGFLNKNQNDLSMELAQNVLNSPSSKFISNKNFIALKRVLHLNSRLWNQVNNPESSSVPKSNLENRESDRNRNNFNETEFAKVKKSFETESQTNKFLKNGSILNQQLQEVFQMAKKMQPDKDSLNIKELNLREPKTQKLNKTSNLLTNRQQEQLEQIKNSGKSLSERRNSKKQMGLINPKLKNEARRTQEKFDTKMNTREKVQENGMKRNEPKI
jgi:hypothetical protein